MQRGRAKVRKQVLSRKYRSHHGSATGIRHFHPQVESLEQRYLLTAVVGRHLFYNESSFDGGSPAINSAADEAARATDKSPYIPNGTTAIAANVSSYTRGINGIMLDLTPDVDHSGITLASVANHFVFTVGNDNTPSSWADAPTPTAVSVIPGGGVSGSDRVEITWGTGAIRNQWLQVKVLSNATTGLADVGDGIGDWFFWGNKIGDSGTSPGAGTFDTTTTDAAQVFATLGSGKPITELRDYNRDGSVTTTDASIVFANLGAIQRINVPAPPAQLSAALANDTGPGGVPNSDGITHDPQVAGTLTSLLALSSFLAGIDAGPVTTNVLGEVQIDGQFTISEALLNSIYGGPLPDGPHTLHLRAENSAGQVTLLDVPFTLKHSLPTIEVSTLVTFTDDVTPHVTIAASDALGLANGTQVVLDVDLNNDGDFDDAGELARTTSTLYNGGSYFELTPALPFTDPIDGPYLVQLRARVTDVAGNEGVSSLSSLKIDTLGSTALYDYVNAPDASYSFSQVFSSVGAGYTYYVLNMRSQTWHLGDVNDPYWDHYLKIVVPNGALADSALLFINGGNNTSGIPTSPDSALRDFALLTHAVTVDLRTVPNEPVFFFAEPGTPSRNEDEIIAYTFDQFVNNIGALGNETWPLLLPMVKSAVRAMDATQSFIPTVRPGETIDDFVVTGYSKRGWTTWLTGAVDNRVKAVIPGVIDLLNMDESMQHHYGFYSGEFAPHVGDYQEFELIQNSFVEANQELGRIVDPYRYLYNSNLTDIPKLLLLSTGDEFFVPDSGQYYMHDLPGSAYVRYIPNTGHGLDSRAGDSTYTFFDAYLNDRTLPEFSWTAEQDGSIRVQTDVPSDDVVVRLWQATNMVDRDFRRSFNPTINWTNEVLSDLGGGVYIGDVDVPDNGARAYMVELTFPSAIPGVPYVFTTEVRVKSNVEITPWDFYMPSNEMEPSLVVSPGFAVPPDDLSAVTFGVALSSTSSDGDSGSSPASLVTVSESTATVASEDPAELMFAELSWLNVDDEDSDGDATADSELDLALDSLSDALAN